MTRLWVKTTSRSAVDGRSLALSPTDARAKELMRDLLDEREYIQVMECGHLDVLSPSQAQRIYRIPLSGGRVRVFERGTAVHELCIQPIIHLSRYDVIVMHKLWIESDEHAYLAHANRFLPLFPGHLYRPDGPSEAGIQR
jgi:hypothetical protein